MDTTQHEEGSGTEPENDARDEKPARSWELGPALPAFLAGYGKSGALAAHFVPTSGNTPKTYTWRQDTRDAFSLQKAGLGRSCTCMCAGWSTYPSKILLGLSRNAAVMCGACMVVASQWFNGQARRPATARRLKAFEDQLWSRATRAARADWSAMDLPRIGTDSIESPWVSFFFGLVPARVAIMDDDGGRVRMVVPGLPEPEGATRSCDAAFQLKAGAFKAWLPRATHEWMQNWYESLRGSVSLYDAVILAAQATEGAYR